MFLNDRIGQNDGFFDASSTANLGIGSNGNIGPNNGSRIDLSTRVNEDVSNDLGPVSAKTSSVALLKEAKIVPIRVEYCSENNLVSSCHLLFSYAAVFV